MGDPARVAVDTSSQPVIIEVGLNGVTTNARNANVPLTPDEIATDALDCMEAGAAIVHSHVDIVDATPEEFAARYVEGWSPVLEPRPDALLYPTVNPGPPTVEHRYAHFPLLARRLGIRIGVCDPGSATMGEHVYVNSLADARYQMSLCASHELGPSMGVFEPGFLRTILGFRERGELPPGGVVKLFFGGPFDYMTGARCLAPFGLPPTQVGLGAYLELLEGTHLPWSAAAVGGDLLASGIVPAVLEAGGHLRVGLEDFGSDDGRQPTNVELVAEAVAACEAAGRPVATPTMAAEALGLQPRGLRGG